ncbi:lasso peptide biosynthesis B2 protein [Paenibacillus alkaliterrae]
MVLIRLDLNTILLFAESVIFLGWVRIQLLYHPFSKIAPSLGRYMAETDIELRVENRIALLNIRNAIQIMSKYTFWESKCLVRAIAAMKMLERRRIGSTLYLGTGKDDSGKMIAHAWLRSGSLYITGAEEMHRFTITGKFGKVI